MRTLFAGWDAIAEHSVRPRQTDALAVAGSDGQRTRLVMVPRFAETGTLVLVNLATLACDPIVFNSSLE